MVNRIEFIKLLTALLSRHHCHDCQLQLRHNKCAICYSNLKHSNKRAKAIGFGRFAAQNERRNPILSQVKLNSVFVNFFLL
jgi:hypothetical protein